MSQNQPPLPSYGFLRLPQILRIIPISRAAWWAGCRSGRFPRPLKLTSRTTVWRVSDIQDFIERVGNQRESSDE
jgi:predicted DNA-binding transcriptional regulator AlpA